MQTFLPYPDIEQSVKCLDYRRLGKQRVEAYQIVQTLQNPLANGWRNHPAVLMWKDNVPALLHYMDACILEWIERGYKNNMKLSHVNGPLPSWWGGPFHGSVRARLLSKNPEYYSKFGWTEVPRSDEEGYIWPIKSRLTV